MKKAIGISGWGGISPLGSDPQSVWRRYQDGHSALSRQGGGCWTGALEPGEEETLEQLRRREKAYRPLDRTVLLAITAAERARQMAGWSSGQTERAAVLIGSSRGATGLWENFYGQFREEGAGKLPPLSSPTTTLGNIASWVAHALGAAGPAISHSMTCSTALHALLMGLSWLESGRGQKVLVGGSEAPLTEFTMAQMKALRIYTDAAEGPFPCLAADPDKRSNTMALGEGAACFCLELDPPSPIAWIEGIGCGNERPETATAMSAQGDCLQEAMRQAMEEAGWPPVDAIVTHTPGTLLGDRAELAAIQEVFGEKVPLLTNNKWKLGHTLGASGALSLEFALLQLRYGQLIEVPYLRAQGRRDLPAPRRLLVNAAGFGGNAVSVLLSRPDSH